MSAELDAASLARGRRFPGSKRVLARLGDEALVDRLRRGSEAAFEAIYDRHHRPLLAFCGRMLGSAEEGEDALQQTFLSAYRALVSDSEKPLQLKPWLYTIARNRCLSMLRARRPETKPLDDRQPSPSDRSDVEQRAEMRQLLEDLNALPESQREALVLSELGDLRHQEVAEVLGCPTNKVKSLVFQARTALIDVHAAREVPCQEVREEIAVLRRLPRGGVMRRHVKSCAGCREFADETRRQRRLMAVALPIVPSLGLKRSVLAAVGGVGGGGAAGGGGGIVAGLAAKAGTATGGLATGGATGGGITTLATGATLAKTTAVALAAGSLALGAGAATKQERSASSSGQRTAGAEGQADSKAGGSDTTTAGRDGNAWKEPGPAKDHPQGRSEEARKQPAPPGRSQPKQPGPPPHASASKQQAPKHPGGNSGQAPGQTKHPAPNGGGGGSGGQSQGGGGGATAKPNLPVGNGRPPKPAVPKVPGSNGNGPVPKVPDGPRLP